MSVILKRIDRRHNDKVGKALAEGNFGELEKVSTDTEYSFDRQLCENVVVKALRLFPGDKQEQYDELDQWLAPRLHYCLRIPRSAASDSGIWTWLAAAVLRPYNEHRWPIQMDKKYPYWRYNDSGILRNGIARLWWAAELLRDGPDYTMVPEGLRRVRVFQNVGELRYSWHKEAARAFTAVTKKSDILGDSLSPALNAYLATRALESFDTDLSDEENFTWDSKWAAKKVKLTDAIRDLAALEGPESGRANKKTQAALEKWISEVLEQTGEKRSKA